MSEAAVPPQPQVTGEAPMALTTEEKTWAMLCHLSVLLAHFALYMTFLGPLICWLMKKDTSKFVDEHGKESLNFQLNVLVYNIVSGLLMLVCIGFFLLAAVFIYNIVMVIIAALKANNGEPFRYPFIFRLIK